MGVRHEQPLYRHTHSRWTSSTSRQRGLSRYLCKMNRLFYSCPFSFWPSVGLGLTNEPSLLQKSLFVIPTEAGIQVFQGFLDPGFRRGDSFTEFCKKLQCFSFLVFFDSNRRLRLSFCSLSLCSSCPFLLQSLGFLFSLHTSLSFLI